MFSTNLREWKMKSKVIKFGTVEVAMNHRTRLALTSYTFQHLCYFGAPYCPATANEHRPSNQSLTAQLISTNADQWKKLSECPAVNSFRVGGKMGMRTESTTVQCTYLLYRQLTTKVKNCRHSHPMLVAFCHSNRFLYKERRIAPGASAAKGGVTRHSPSII